MQTTKDLAKALIDRLAQRVERDTPDAPALFSDAPEYAIHDGAGYGDPLRDTRPDFVKQDDPPGLRRGRFR